MELSSIIWLVLLILFVVVEAGTVMLVSVWFAIGSLAALICSLLGGEVWLQAVLFVGVSALSLWALWPLRKKLITSRITKTNVDALIGTTGKVLEPIHNENGTGRVRLGGMDWAARSSDGSVIEAQAMIRVDKIEGVKVFVSPVKVNV